MKGLDLPISKLYFDSMSVNKHNLPRRIPSPVRRKVRQRCGFGCIVCGYAIIQYHHFNPEFADAIEHNADGITLLCGRCHDKAHAYFTPGRINELNQNPKCLQTGYTRDDFLFLASDKIHFQIGSATFRNHAVILYDDIPLMAFAQPMDKGEPLLLSARMETQDGKQLMEIEDNEWRVGVDHFDVETVANSLTIRKKLGDLLLHMTIKDSDVEFDKLQMGFRGYKIGITEGLFDVSTPDGSRMLLACPNIHSPLRLSSSGGVAL